MKISLIIPAYNEESTIKEVMERSKPFVDEIIVADDNSTDDTALIAVQAGAKVVKNSERGYEGNIANAVPHSSGDVIITIDADIEHKPEDIELFKQKIEQGCDVVVGKRPKLPRKGEVLLSALTEKEFSVADPLCGFKAIRKEVFEKIPFAKHGFFGLDFVLGAIIQGFKVVNIDISEMPVREKPRVGTEEEIDKKLAKIREHVKEKYGL